MSYMIIHPIVDRYINLDPCISKYPRKDSPCFRFNINPNLLKVIAAEGEQKASRALKEVSKQIIKCKKEGDFSCHLTSEKEKKRVINLMKIVLSLAD